MKILGVGESIIDNIYACENLVEATTENSQLVGQDIGGPVLSALILLSRLGLDCSFMSTVGNDAYGDLISAKLKFEKVTFLPAKQDKTKVNAVLIEAASGQRKKVRGHTQHAPLKDINTQYIQEFDLILIDRHERIAFHEICDKKKLSTQLLIDPSDEVSEFTLSMLKAADLPIIPLEAVAKMTGIESLQESLIAVSKHCHKPLIVTAGPHGSFICDSDGVVAIPAVQISAVDVTGAGDIYRGSIAYGVSRKWSLVKSAEFASRVSALQCLKIGNVSAIPSRSDVEKILKQNDITPSFSSNTIINHYFQAMRRI